MTDPQMPADNSTAEFDVVPGPTGTSTAGTHRHPGVDAALERLEQAGTLPPIDQIGAYDAALVRCRRRLPRSTRIPR
jgi:hypothetical protein